MLKNIIGWLGVVIVGFVLFGIFYFMDGKDYLLGHQFHYKGSSNITLSQMGELALKLDIGPTEYCSVEVEEILDDNTVKVKYDFYSKEEYNPLNKNKFSFLDTAFINLLYSLRYPMLKFFGYCGIPIVLLYILLIIVRKKRVKGSDVAWYITHPDQLFKKEVLPELRYNLQMVSTPDIPKANGIYCVRTWKYKDGLLFSVGVGKSCWKSKVLYSDKLPERSNQNGVYAFRLGLVKDSEYPEEILGVVELSGDWCEHADGVLRAERCEILHLFLKENLKLKAHEISTIYGVSVSVEKNVINSYFNWLNTPNGIDCMLHNAEILNKEEALIG